MSSAPFASTQSRRAIGPVISVSAVAVHSQHEPGGGEVERPPFGAVQRPAVLLTHAGGDVAAFADFEPDPRRPGDVTAAEVTVEEPELGRAGFGRVKGGPLTAAVGIEEPVGAGDAFPAAD